MNFDHFKKVLTSYPQNEIREHVSASSLTTFRIGGDIRMVVYPKTAADLIQVIRLCIAADVPWRVVGCGSNLLVSDAGFNGVWILTTNFDSIQIHGNHAEVSSGVPLDVLLEHLADAGLSGCENLAGIPGSVGGATVMNAGAFGTQFSDMIVAVDVFDVTRNALYSMPYESCGFAYRRSVFQKNRLIVCGVSLRLGRSRDDIIRARATSVRKQREASQPYDLPSAGSVFRRPRGHFAGKLIADAGFSGYRVGDAAVSEKHNGFIVNLGEARSEDVKTIITQIRKRVFETTGVLLQTEIIYV